MGDSCRQILFNEKSSSSSICDESGDKYFSPPGNWLVFPTSSSEPVLLVKVCIKVSSSFLVSQRVFPGTVMNLIFFNLKLCFFQVALFASSGSGTSTEEQYKLLLETFCCI